MAEVEKKNGVVVKNEHNEFELALRFLGNELIAIKMAATNFSGKLIVWSILLLLFSFMLLEVFGLSAYFGIKKEKYYDTESTLREYDNQF